MRRVERVEWYYIPYSPRQDLATDISRRLGRRLIPAGRLVATRGGAPALTPQEQAAGRYPLRVLRKAVDRYFSRDYIAAVKEWAFSGPEAGLWD